jgi:hypothetical protein
MQQEVVNALIEQAEADFRETILNRWRATGSIPSGN